MIAYFDTSALVTMLVRERGWQDVVVAWERAPMPVSSSLMYVEARAALASIRRSGRVRPSRMARAEAHFERLLDGSLVLLSVDHRRVIDAAGAAVRHALRAYDAVHLVTAVDLERATVVSGDGALLRAARAEGMDVIAPV